MLEENKIHLGDCLDLLPGIPSKSVDMILCDLPYGTTECSWDSIIDMARLWAEYERVIKDNGAIVLMANSHFVFTLHASNPKLFRYKWIWVKSRVSRFLDANRKPMGIYEEILIFYKNPCVYNPQKTGDILKHPKINKIKQHTPGAFYSGRGAKGNILSVDDGSRYPLDVFHIESMWNTEHPTQKPVALFEYLIKTYTNENELVLDNCSGSGTTAIACMNTNRRFICIERDETYHRKSIERMNNHEPLFHLGNN